MAVAAAWAVLVLIEGCAQTPIAGGGPPTQSPSVQSPSAEASAQPTPTATPQAPRVALSTVTDPRLAFSFGYPAGWSEVDLQGGTAGMRAFASRSDIRNLLDLQPADLWLAARSFAPSPATACGEPVSYVAKREVELDGLSATEFKRLGTQGDPQQTVFDVLAIRNGNCISLQLVAGRQPQQSPAAVIEAVEASVRF